VLCSKHLRQLAGNVPPDLLAVPAPKDHHTWPAQTTALFTQRQLLAGCFAGHVLLIETACEHHWGVLSLEGTAVTSSTSTPADILLPLHMH
jgi:hypothetical protein